MRIGLGDEALLYVPALGETLQGAGRAIDRTTGFVEEQEQRPESRLSLARPRRPHRQGDARLRRAAQVAGPGSLSLGPARRRRLPAALDQLAAGARIRQRFVARHLSGAMRDVRAARSY